MAEYRRVKLECLAASEPGSIAIGPFGSRMKADVYLTIGVPVIRGTNISGDRSLTGDWVYVSESFASAIPNCIATVGDLVFPNADQ
jgi:type I restriction enzyme S subunit